MGVVPLAEFLDRGTIFFLPEYSKAAYLTWWTDPTLLKRMETVACGERGDSPGI